MKSLRVRLTLWFALSFLAVTAGFMFFTYRHLDLELRKKTFQREFNINPNWILHGSYAEGEVREIMAELVVASLIYSLPLVLVTLLLGYFIARKSLSPVASLNRQLQAVSPRTLQQRVSLPEADEQLRDLVNHLNDMLARLQRSFNDMSEYAAKVAHELRTPLTILRLKVEQADGRIEADLAEELHSELHRLSHVVDQALLIAKADQGRLEWKLEQFDLAVLLSELVKDFHLLAAEEGRELRLEAPAHCLLETDPKYCKQILHSLLTNALMHGRGPIRLRLRVRRGHVTLTLCNQVRSPAKTSEATLGLGLRVVRALLALQPAIRFRQHHGQRFHATSISCPAVKSSAGAVASLDNPPRAPRQPLAGGSRRSGPPG